MFDLNGRVAVITGGSSGIGFGMAKGLAQCGCEVSIWDLNPETTSTAREALAGLGPQISTQICDVSDSQQVKLAFEKTLEIHGRIDGCFSNAGIGDQSRRFDEIKDEDWQRIIETNLNGTFFVFRLAARHMRERANAGDAFGRLVATSSLAAISGQTRGQHYASTKGGVISMIKSLATEYAKYGVTAHSILPGFVKTPLSKSAFDNPEFVKSAISRIPTRRVGTGDDFSALAAYIMSDGSSWHTGQDFIVDGGFWVF